MSRSRSSLQGWLKNAGLQRFYANFVEKGINEENFIHLQFGDYDDVGITDHADRQRLFKLIQVVRRQIEKPSGGASSSSSGGGGGGGGGGDGGGGGGGSVSESPPSTAQSDGGSSSHSSRRSSSPRKNRGSGIPKPKSKRASSGIPVSSRPKSASRRSKSPRPDDGGSSRLHAMKDVPEDEVPPRSASSPPGQVVQDASTSSKIRVVIRKRPLSKREKSRGEGDIITFEDDDINTVYVHEPKTKVDLTKYTEKHCFVFDESFDERATNELIYERTCLPLVDFFLNAGKVTCFAYGQTGAGKTYTMMGPEGGKTVQNGLYALAAQDIFASIEAYPQLALFVSFFEIYGGKLYDLLNNRNKLVCREDGSMKVNIVGVKEVQCRTADELMELMAVGNGTRSTGKTGANADSSRSHAILQMILKRADRKQKWRVHGKFSFIDLAGSERGADTSANSRQTRLEGAEINKSLLALKECIRALDQGAHHTPFRGSKLTQVLKDSFVGNSKTVMIAAVSPNGSSVEHTLNTLRYADRVKEMRKSSKSKSRSVDAYMPHAHAKRNVVEQYGDEDDDDEEDVPPEDLPTLGVRHRPGHTSATVSEDQQRRDTGAGRSHMSDQRRRRVAEEEAKRRQEQQDDLERTHQELCESIVEIEDQIVDSHRRQIDSTMKLVKEEMQLLKQFDQQAFDVSDYVNALDMVLAQKVESIVSLREKIQLLHAYIQERDLLSSTLAPNNDDALDVVDVDADDFDLLGN